MSEIAEDLIPGRTCPLRYRYGARAIAPAPARRANTLYVIGGLYGNVPALDVIEAMARGERATLCFNGDFNWFDVADEHFVALNQRVLAYHAIVGNVEAEFDSPTDDAGCGCAYPDNVDASVVERSNVIHKTLKATAQRHPALLRRIAALPMVARYQVGDCRVGVVHGDADSLAGWGFDAAALADPSQRAALAQSAAAAEVDVFASTHTCLPALCELDRAWIANNGAAGMPNFASELYGLVTRIATTPSPHEVVHEVRAGGVFVALLPVRYDTARWEAQFLAQWPAGSPAWTSYHQRIARGPAFRREQVLAGAAGCAV